MLYSALFDMLSPHQYRPLCSRVVRARSRAIVYSLCDVISSSPHTYRLHTASFVNARPGRGVALPDREHRRQRWHRGHLLEVHLSRQPSLRTQKVGSSVCVSSFPNPVPVYCTGIYGPGSFFLFQPLVLSSWCLLGVFLWRAIRK